MSVLNPRTVGLVLFNLILLCNCHSIPSKSNYTFQCSLKKETHNHKDFVPKFRDVIGFQVSHRATHQLMTRIFAIYLREIIGYQNITFHMGIDIADEEHKLWDLLDGLKAPFSKWPERAIDLEVWLHPDYHAVPRFVTEAGLSTDPGRFGWFVPTELIDVNETERVQQLHYSVFKNPSNTYYNEYIIDGDVINNIKQLYGFQKEYIPKWCENVSCVTLLAEYYNDTAFVEKHIEEYKFYVKVLWIGNKYKQAVFGLFEDYNHKIEYRKHRKKFILLHWTPSDVIDAHLKFETITMPKCEDIESRNSTLCKYELTPLLKFRAHQLMSVSYVFDALEEFYISPVELRKVLIESNELSKNASFPIDAVYDRVACNWLRSNENIYKTWSRQSNITLKIGGIFPVSGGGETYSNIIPAVLRAAAAINANSTVLPNLKIVVYTHDGQCRSDIVMKTFIHYYSISPFLGILGPACSETVEPIAGVSKHTHTAVVSYSAEGASFTDREKYPYFFRTIGSNRQYEAVYLNLFKAMQWRRVAAITEDGQKYTEYISHMESLLRENDIRLIVNEKFPKDIKRNDMKLHLQNLKEKHAKIIIADISNENALLVMCEAFQLQMTPAEGYVWFLPVWIFKSLTNETMLNIKQNITCTPEEIEEIITGHFAFTHAPFASNSSIMEENITVQKWLEEMKFPNTVSSLSDYSGFAYDAVWVYALAADKLFRENPVALDEMQSPEIAKKFSDIIWKLDFNGISGRIRFGDGGSRITDVNILQWINMQYRQVGKHIPEVNENMQIVGHTLALNESEIVWFYKDGRPDDGTLVCPLEKLAEILNTDCENVSLILTTFCCLLLVVIISLASFIFWKRKYDKKLKHSAKVMRNFGIDLLSPSMSLHNTLDKWEVPKDKVVINRRLGEGAFGTVYGGEAQFVDDEWTAVAVKTLKVGGSTEDKLDFLSEAEAMKRFDHKNIVKLLGVCLQTEPIYTIMEFMLYGDLKTFLLARRHLVNEKITDDSDISSKRLTMMALDVARGLSYLADQKYVHRDIACRNCLINAKRVVKIGDFGMARPMFENDYYRFNRKGMLPVRWMSPESLALGLFTPSSDVWSFGVLLFEIVTFGSFPYQGLTNNEVLEFIKSGKSLEIPPAAKPHLEGLMRACWNQDYKKRPCGSEIVEYVSNYPRLLTPCLDIPLASVQIPETESDQLEVLPGLRKRFVGQQPQQPLDILARTSNINNFDQKYIREKSDMESSDNDLLKSINVSLNVQPDSVSNDENSINAYSPMQPLLKYNNEVTGSNLSLKRYVPMYSSALNKHPRNKNPVNLINHTEASVI